MTPKWKHSIRAKLTSVIMVTSGTAVLLTFLGFTVSGLRNFQKRLEGDLTAIAQMVAVNTAPALASGDQQAAQKLLSTLQARSSIIAAAIYTTQGRPFARYEPASGISIPRTILPDGFHAQPDRLEFFSSIRLDGKRIGVLYIAADARDRNSRLRQYFEIAIGIVLGSLLVAFVLAWWLQGGITEPIAELARVARLVSLQDFSVRAKHRALNDGDEIGNLMVGFNSMLAEIEHRDDRLLLIQTSLEKAVASRTEQLTIANTELLAAKNAADQIAAVNAQLARESALILNSTTDGILGINLQNRATFLNPAGARLLGMTLRDMEGKSIHEAIHHSRADGTPWSEGECANATAMRGGSLVSSSEDTFWRADGTSFPVEYSSTSIFDKDGTAVGAVLTFRDATERRAIDRLKSEFVATVSHELRTPLTSIRGALGLLGSGLLGPIAEKGQRMLEIALTNTDRLVRLINDVLDLERIGSGKAELARDSVDAYAVSVQAAEGVLSMAHEAGVRVVVERSYGTLWADSDRIIQALTNLLGNAIKFSPPDTIVTLSGVATGAEFTFCVADEGRGVPEEKLQSIFDRFSQVDASDSRDKGGSGLGLAICRSIVTASGGRIWAEPNEPTGTRFRFTIPLADSARVLSPATPANRIETSHAGTGPQEASAVSSNEPRIALAADSRGEAALPAPDDAEGRQVRKSIESMAGRQDHDLIETFELASDAPSVLLVEDDRGENRHAS